MAQYFNLTLDTTAPGGGILSGLNSYYKGNATVTISASGASYMKVWTSQAATGTTSDTGYPSNWEAYNTSKSVSFTGQGTQYVHAQFMDSVGNISTIVNSAAVTYDTVAPTVSSVSINSDAGYTRLSENTVRVTFSDATSGVQKVTLSGDIAAAEKKDYILDATDRSNGYKDIPITFSSPDGTKTVTATVTDFSGNTSTSKSDTIVYDTTEAEITPVLREADDSANLPGYIKYRDYGVRIVTDATDITHYKIWAGNTEPSAWEDITDVTAISGVGYFVGDLLLPSGDGVKTIHVKVQDISGNVTTGTNLTVTLDTTAPTVTLSANPTVISAVSGHNSTTFTCGATDTNSSQGFTYALKLGTSVIKSGTFTSSVSVTASEIEAISSGQGAKSFTLEVTDIAGNTGTSTAQVITLDKTAPTGSITASQYYAATNVGVTLAGSDTGGATLAKMKLWLDSATEPSSWSNFAAGTYTFTSVTEGQHTAHMKLQDSVGNTSGTINSSSFIVDTTAPTGSLSTNAFTNTRSITVTVTYSDAKNSLVTSGVAQMKVWEDGTTEPSWETVAASKSITLSTGDGTKTINLKLKDNAGNVTSTVVATCSTILDTDKPDAVLSLYKTDGSTALPAHVNTRGFTAVLAYTEGEADRTDNNPTDIVAYQLTGDFTAASDSWKTWTYDAANKNTMTLTGLMLTDTDGLKTIVLKLKDAAGNITATGATATTTYDSAPPVIDITTNPDYNIVSKQHTARLNASGTPISGKYNDMCTFSWSANEALRAYKVCVNEVGQTAAEAVAIGTTHGSQNMTGGSVAADTDVTSVIMGADFAATAAVDDTDGAYEIIVYGQDLGGTWSAVHVIS